MTSSSGLDTQKPSSNLFGFRKTNKSSLSFNRIGEQLSLGNLFPATGKTTIYSSSVSDYEVEESKEITNHYIEGSNEEFWYDKKLKLGSGCSADVYSCFRRTPTTQVSSGAIEQFAVKVFHTTQE